MALNTSNWFEYPTNYSNGTSVEGVGSWIQYVNFNILEGSLGLGIILLIWLASFVMSLVAGSKKALLTSSFIAFVFSIYLYRLDMINPLVIMILIAMAIVGALGSKEGKY